MFSCDWGSQNQPYFISKRNSNTTRHFCYVYNQKDVRLVTVNSSKYWVYRYEGTSNGVENTVILFCWPNWPSKSDQCKGIF